MEQAGPFDAGNFRSCVEGKDADARIERDLALGRELGVRSTPTLFINGHRVTGVRIEQIQTLIQEAASR